MKVKLFVIVNIDDAGLANDLADRCADTVLDNLGPYHPVMFGWQIVPTETGKM